MTLKETLQQLLRTITFTRVADWLIAYETWPRLVDTCHPRA